MTIVAVYTPTEEEWESENEFWQGLYEKYESEQLPSDVDYDPYDYRETLTDG